MRGILSDSYCFANNSEVLSEMTHILNLKTIWKESASGIDGIIFSMKTNSKHIISSCACILLGLLQSILMCL